MPSGTDIIARGLGSKGITLGELANQRIDAIPKGLVYKGSVATVSDLPAASEENKGHLYTILADGHEYVSDGVEWVDLSADLINKQDVLVSGENIKTINNTSILGSGNISIPVVDLSWVEV